MSRNSKQTLAGGTPKHGDDLGLRGGLGFGGGHVPFSRRVYVGPQECTVPQSLPELLKTHHHLSIRPLGHPSRPENPEAGCPCSARQEETVPMS